MAAYIDFDEYKGEHNNFDDEEEVGGRAPKRYIRDGENPFELYGDAEFKHRYRFTKESLRDTIVPKIEQPLAKRNNRGLPITPAMQLLITLRFYATGSFQLMSNDAFGVSQPTVSRIVSRVSFLLASFLPEYIVMPTTAAAEIENRRLFEELGAGKGGVGLPNVDGIIACTHIKVTPPIFDNISESFRNKKGHYSLKVQAVVGPRMEFMDIVPQWAGGVQESRIFQNSRLHKRYAEGMLGGELVGDNAYPSLPFLLTPILNATTPAQEKYNATHARTRNIVEKAFAAWKRRFPCLTKSLTTTLRNSTTVIVACAVLHNFSLMCDHELPEADEENEAHEEKPEDVDEPHWQPEEGLEWRQELIDRLFTN